MITKSSTTIMPPPPPAPSTTHDLIEAMNKCIVKALQGNAIIWFTYDEENQ